MTTWRTAGPPPTWGHTHRTVKEVMDTNRDYRHFRRLHDAGHSPNKEFMARLNELLKRARRNNPPELWPENTTDGTEPNDAA